MRAIMLFTMVLTIVATQLFAQSGSMQIGGKKRDYIVHAPSGLPENPALVLALHPMSGDGPGYQTMSGWDKIADKEKFVVVYPTGIYNVPGMNMVGWDITGDSDINFMLALIDTMAARYKIDRKRVYSSGYSMGGMLSYVIACRKSDIVAAIGSLSGFPVGQNASECKPSRPVPVCHIHGLKDDFVKYNDALPWVKKFADVDKCQSAPKTVKTDSYTRDDYGPCENGNEVIFYSIEGMDHGGAANMSKFNFSPSDTFWAFFSRHPGTTQTKKTIQGASQTVPTFSAVFSGGRIYLSVNREINAIRVFDINGKVIYTWMGKVSGGQEKMMVPVDCSSGRIYIINVAGPAGSSVGQLLIP